MGRIADALKKAEQERLLSAQLSRRITPLPAQELRPVAPRATATPHAERPAATPRPAAPATPPAAARDLDGSLLVLHERASAVAEQYRALRTWLLSHNATGEHRLLAVTSSRAGEGKTLTVANLGLALAEVRHLNALVVDCNLGAGQLGNRLGVRGGPGLAEVLAGECALMDAVHDSCVGNLKVLPAGMLGSNSRSELLNSRLMPRVMDEIRERFHYVLVDTPAVQAAADVGRIGALCTGVLMVVRMQRTSAALVRQSVRWLAANNVHVLGCVAVGADNRAARMQYDSSAA